METDATTTEDEVPEYREAIRRARRQLASWATGRADWIEPSETGTTTIVVEDPDHVEPLLDSGLVGPDSALFVPGEVDLPPERCFGVGYEGSLREPGSDLSVDDDYFVETQDYASSGFIVVMGPTFLRVTCEEDFRAFYDDADLAYGEGTFPPAATNPYVMMADEQALGSGTDSDGPQLRLYVADDGTLSVGPFGASLGKVGDSMPDLVSRWRAMVEDGSPTGGPALSLALDEMEPSDETADRPWLPRYFVALDAIRDLAIRGVVEPRVSGFGGTRNARLTDVATTVQAATAPVLLWDDDQAYLRLPATNRVFEFDSDGADAAEALLILGSAERASEFADPQTVQRLAAAFAASNVSLTGAVTT